jgi:hypothetical protein
MGQRLRDFRKLLISGTLLAGLVACSSASAAPAAARPAPTPAEQASQSKPEPSAEEPAKSPAPPRERSPELVIPPPPPLPGPARQAPPVSATARPAPPSAAPAPSSEIVLPEGTVIEVRLAERLSSATNRVGDHFDSILDRDIENGQGEVIVPKGTTVQGTIVDAAEPGRVKGRASLTFRLERLELGHDDVDITTNEISIEAESGKADDAKRVGIGAAVGAAVGAIFGGRRGAAVGGATGAGGSAARVLLTKGRQVVIDRERLFSFRLEQEVTLPEH